MNPIDQLRTQILSDYTVADLTDGEPEIRRDLYSRLQVADHAKILETQS